MVARVSRALALSSGWTDYIVGFCYRGLGIIRHVPRELQRLVAAGVSGRRPFHCCAHCCTCNRSSFLTALQTVRNPQIYHTLLHIAFVTVWTFPAMATPGLWPRLLQLCVTAALLVTFHATFYWVWIKTYELDEGGYFGFLGWAIEALVGSFVYDLTQVRVGGQRGASCQQAHQAPSPSPLQWAARVDDNAGASSVAATSTPSNSALASGKAERTPLLAKSSAAAGVTVPSSSAGLGVCGCSALDSCAGAVAAWLTRLAAGRLLGCTGARQSPARGAAFLVALGLSAALMLLGWLLACLGSVAPLTVCYDSGDRIFFFGGYGDVVPCPARDSLPPAPFQASRAMGGECGMASCAPFKALSATTLFSATPRPPHRSSPTPRRSPSPCGR